MNKIRNLSKLPKRKVTVDELLELDNINDLLTHINNVKADISELVIIYTTGTNILWNTAGTTASRLIYLLEHTKLLALNKDSEED